MATGFTKTEQGAMAGLVVLIVAGLAFQARGPSGGDGEGVWIERGGRWQSVTETRQSNRDIGSAPAALTSPSGAQPASGGNAPTQSNVQPPSQQAVPPAGVAQNQVLQEPRADASAVAPGLIDINAAPAGELERLPGIGPVKSRAIVQYRERAGPFASVEQLTEVGGIGPKTLEKIRSYVAAGGGSVRIEQPAAPSAAHAPMPAPQANPLAPATPVQPPRVNTVQPPPAAPQAAPPWESNTDSSAAPAYTRPQRININTASYERLQEIPGVGPVYARRIMQRRVRRRFANTAELIEIKGIGNKTYQKMRPFVTVR